MNKCLNCRLFDENYVCISDRLKVETKEAQLVFLSNQFANFNSETIKSWIYN
jgi:hypothetical protein